jgi:hypothetical protein
MNPLRFALLIFICIASPVLAFTQAANQQGEFYQITIYHFANAEQQALIDQYLKDAYLLALHRQQIKQVGVFTAMSNDTAADKRVYVILPIKSTTTITELAGALEKDDQYLANAKPYQDAGYKSPAYTRMEKILLKSFPLAPSLVVPKLKSANTEKVYELRSYESPTEKLFESKVKMFNEGGEIALFKELNFNAVFYASVIAGSRMPNLMYMTSFENMADRDAHWKSFSDAPAWKKLLAMPEYQNNVSRNEINFLRATAYSDY